MATRFNAGYSPALAAHASALRGEAAPARPALPPPPAAVLPTRTYAPALGAPPDAPERRRREGSPITNAHDAATASASPPAAPRSPPGRERPVRERSLGTEAGVQACAPTAEKACQTELAPKGGAPQFAQEAEAASADDRSTPRKAAPPEAVVTLDVPAATGRTGAARRVAFTDETGDATEVIAAGARSLAAAEAAAAAAEAATSARALERASMKFAAAVDGEQLPPDDSAVWSMSSDEEAELSAGGAQVSAGEDDDLGWPTTTAAAPEPFAGGANVERESLASLAELERVIEEQHAQLVARGIIDPDETLDEGQLALAELSALDTTAMSDVLEQQLRALARLDTEDREDPVARAAAPTPRKMRTGSPSTSPFR